MARRQATRGAIQALATGTAACAGLVALYLIKSQHSHEVDRAELHILFKELVQELKAAVTHDVWREGIKKFKAPQYGRSNADGSLSEVIEFGLQWRERVTSKQRFLDTCVAKSVKRLRRRIDEIILYECHFPRPSLDLEYRQRKRFFFLLRKYWSAYRSILEIQASAPPLGRSHPLSREIAALKFRIQHCAKKTGDRRVRDSFSDLLRVVDPLWGEEFRIDWNQRGLQSARECDRAVDEAAARLGGRTFPLTPFESQFLDHVKREQGRLTKSVRSKRKRVAVSAVDAVSRCSSLKMPKVHTKPLHSSPLNREGATLSEAEEREEERWSFKSRLPIVITGEIEEQCKHVVVVDGRKVLLPNRPFTVFLRLARELTKGKDGFVPTEELMKDHVVYSKSDSNRMASELRKAFRHALEGKIGKFEFIQTPELMVRLSTHPRYVDYSQLKGKPLKQFHPAVREQIRKLPRDTPHPSRKPT